MSNDNTTPFAAKSYDKEINNTIPYYGEFYDQTLDVIEQYESGRIKWLDLGCGTGTLQEIARQRFSDIQFTLVDPSEKMLEQAKRKLNDGSVQYICASSACINFQDCFDVVTAIQSHHYMREEERRKATERVYNALASGGIYISFENVIPEDEELKAAELLRWGRYQQRHGKTAEEAKAHNSRCGVNYFPLTVNQHINLLKETGFSKVHVFWLSYMQMGIYAIK
ncbi:MAG: class I SAM-dependent methyltransferase [Candidatus Coproplasma sp.]